MNFIAVEKKVFMLRWNINHILLFIFIISPPSYYSHLYGSRRAFAAHHKFELKNFYSIR